MFSVNCFAEVSPLKLWLGESYSKKFLWKGVVNTIFFALLYVKWIVCDFNSWTTTWFGIKSLAQDSLSFLKVLLHYFCHFKSKLHKRKKCNRTKESKQQNDDLWENIYNFTSQRTNTWKVLQIWDKRQNPYRKKKA